MHNAHSLEAIREATPDSRPVSLSHPTGDVTHDSRVSAMSCVHGLKCSLLRKIPFSLDGFALKWVMALFSLFVSKVFARSMRGVALCERGDAQAHALSHVTDGSPSPRRPHLPIHTTKQHSPGSSLVQSRPRLNLVGQPASERSRQRHHLNPGSARAAAMDADTARASFGVERWARQGLSPFPQGHPRSSPRDAHMRARAGPQRDLSGFCDIHFGRNSKAFPS